MDAQRANASVLKRMWSVYVHNVVCHKRTNTDTEGWNNNKWNRAIAKAGWILQDCRLVSSKVTRRTYSHRLLSRAQSDIDHNNMIDTPRLLRILAHLVCMDNAG